MQFCTWRQLSQLCRRERSEVIGGSLAVTFILVDFPTIFSSVLSCGDCVDKLSFKSVSVTKLWLLFQKKKRSFN
jgi:hypothetical protein